MIEYGELLDEMKDLNAMLEVCRGYTQSDVPDMNALELTLYFLQNKYQQLHDKFLECRNA